MTLFSWDGEIDTILSPRDSIWYNKYFLHSGMMSMDPKTGHVKAYVGGINYKHFKYDHVKVGKRQVGSTFKPFLYALAMQEGYSPCYEILNVPVVFDKEKMGAQRKIGLPKNSGDEFDEMSITLKVWFGKFYQYGYRLYYEAIRPLMLWLIWQKRLGSNLRF